MSGQDERAAAISAIGSIISVPGIRRFVQYGRDRQGARIVIEMEDGRSLMLGPPDVLFWQAEFHKALLMGLGIPVGRVGTNEWRDIVTAIITKCTDVEDDPDATLAGRTGEWLRRYMARCSVERADEVIEAREPFHDEEAFYVAAQSLRQYAAREFLEQVGAEDMRAALRGMKGTRITLTYVTAGGARTSAGYYRIPREELDAA